MCVFVKKRAHIMPAHKTLSETGTSAAAVDEYLCDLFRMRRAESVWCPSSPLSLLFALKRIKSGKTDTTSRNEILGRRR